MKDRIIGFAVLVAVMMLTCFCVTVANDASAPTSFTLTTNSITILPDRSRQTASEWTTNTVYAEGDYVANTNYSSSRPQRIYFALNAGTSGTNRPVHLNGDVSDGGVTWRRVISGLRKGFVIVLSNTNGTANLGVDHPAVAGKGILLTGQGSSFGMDNDSIQGELMSVGSVSGVVVSVQEW